MEKFEDALLCQSPLVSEIKAFLHGGKKTTTFHKHILEHRFTVLDHLPCCQGEALASPSDHKPSLLALTASSWLYRLSAETGEELQRVYLSSNQKFRYRVGSGFSAL